jgi:hypothetical protein
VSVARIWVLAVVLITSTPARAYDASKLESSAKYIVVGRVISRTAQDIVRIELVSVLKGREVIGHWKDFQVALRPCSSSRISCLSTGDVGVFFIKSADEGWVSFVDNSANAIFDSSHVR